MSGAGFTMSSADDAGHIGWPKPGTYVREKDGEHVNLLNATDYPIVAVCKMCGGKIRLAHLMQMDWRHVPVAPATSAPPAGGTAS